MTVSRKKKASANMRVYECGHENTMNAPIMHYRCGVHGKC